VAMNGPGAPAEATFDGACTAACKRCEAIAEGADLCGASPALQIDGRMAPAHLPPWPPFKDEAELLCAVQMLRAADLLRRRRLTRRSANTCADGCAGWARS
jgi:hypothetical protein